MEKFRSVKSLVRPFTLIAPAIGFSGAGLIAWSTLPGRPLFPELSLYIVLGSVSAAILNGASNSLNQLFDIDIDMINKPGRPLPSGSLSATQVTSITIILYIIGLSLAWLVRPAGSHQYFYLAIGASVFSFLYSAPPFRTKRFPLLSNITIALPRGMLPVAGWSAVRSVADIEPWSIGLLFTIFLIGAASTKDFSDIKGDALYGCRTLPVCLGIPKSTKVIAPFLALPWLLFIPLSVFRVVTGNPSVLIPLSLVLSLWGAYVAYLLMRDPEALALTENHVSWKHMYLLMICAYAGLTLAYLF